MFKQLLMFTYGGTLHNLLDIVIYIKVVISSFIWSMKRPIFVKIARVQTNSVKGNICVLVEKEIDKQY